MVIFYFLLTQIWTVRFKRDPKKNLRLTYSYKVFTHFKPSNHMAKRSLATFMYVYDYHGKPRDPRFN